MVRAYNKLTEKQKNEINQLVEKCNAFDGTNRSLYLESDINIDPYLNCFFLNYIDEYIVSVITAIQVDDSVVELRGFTLPEERNKGYFLELVDYVEEEFLVNEITSYQFVVDPNNKNCQYVLERCDAKYNYSSYLLELDLEKYTIQGLDKQLDNITVVPLDENRIQEAIKISNELFPEDSDYVDDMMDAILHDEHQYGYLIMKDNRIIGLGNISVHGQSASIFGLGISTEYQGRGLGKYLLRYLLQEITQRGVKKVRLEVSSKRKEAFHMYKNEGFVINDQNDYYETKIQLMDDYSTFLED